jgi:hypothetical protein
MMGSAMVLRCGFASLLLALVSAGSCGQPVPDDDPRQAVVEATEAYQTAFIEKDARALCDALSSEAQAEIITGATNCEGAAERVFDVVDKDDLARISRHRDSLSIADVKIQNQRATVRLSGGRNLRMVREGEWLVEAQQR